MTPPQTRNDTLARSIEYCREVTRRRARNFYYGLKLAPEPKRSALYVLYAWMRKADDLVDGADRESPQKAEVRLRRFAERTRGALNGDAPESRHPLWPALAHVADFHSLDPKHFFAMLDGQLADLDKPEYQTFDELRDYCLQVASSVGLLCISVWGYRDREAEVHAVDRGIAFQLTNVLRDFSEDYDAGRVYLPAEDFRRHAISPQILRAWSEPARCERFMREQIDRAQSYYDSSGPLDELIESECRPVLWAMTRIYASLLARISDSPQRTVRGPRIRVSSIRKGLIAIEAKRQQWVTPDAAAGVRAAAGDPANADSSRLRASGNREGRRLGTPSRPQQRAGGPLGQ